MTENDVLSLSNNNIYEFRTSYGVTHYGILANKVLDRSKYYIIPPNKIKKWNNERSAKKNDAYEVNGDPINIANIVRWRPLPRAEIEANSIIRVGEGKSFGNQKATKLVITGAGASYDINSLNKYDYIRPPLANSLFDVSYESLYSKYVGVISILSTLRRENDIEDFFQREWEFITQHFAPFQLKRIINIQYYLQRLLHEVSEKNGHFDNNNYIPLIESSNRYSTLNNEKTLFVNFNYDTLLEKAIEYASGLRFNHISDYINIDSNIQVYKIHGSCNWGWSLKKKFDKIQNVYDIEDMANWVYEHVEDLDELTYEYIVNQEDIKVVNNWWTKPSPGAGAIQVSAERYMLYPAIFLPFKDKDDFVMPNEHTSSLRHHLNGIKDILVIGWKGEEAVFNKLLNTHIHQNDISLTIVAPKKDAPSIKRKMEDTLKKEIKTYKQYDSFTAFIENQGDRIFFSN